MYKYIEIVLYDTNKVVKRIDVKNRSEKQIDKIEDGLNINLNHDQYFTRVSESNIQLELEPKKINMSVPSKNIDILSYREWLENSVAISTSNGTTSIFSLQQKNLFLSGDESLKKKLDDKHERGGILLKVYQDNFDWIQKQHQLWLKENNVLT